MNDSPSILLVEDEPDLADLFCRMLRRGDLPARSVSCGRAALQLIVEGWRPDAVVLDILLPDMDGLDLCGRLRDRLGAELPILFITGVDNEQAVRDGFRAGGDDYLIKPIQQHELVRRVKTLMELAASGRLKARRMKVLSRVRGN